MAVSIGNDMMFSQINGNAKADSAEKLSSKLAGLSKDNASDEELMDACKSFEEYLVEQVVKSTKEAMLPKDDEEEENEYMTYFGDNLYREYAKMISDNANLGIAQMLFESMKNNGK